MTEKQFLDGLNALKNRVKHNQSVRYHDFVDLIDLLESFVRTEHDAPVTDGENKGGPEGENEKPKI